MLGDGKRDAEQAFFEPHERQLHRLLGLVGHGPTAQYADAVRILRGVPPLQTRSHLVGHMAREIDSAVRKLLSEIIPRAEWSKLEAAKAKDQRDPSKSQVIDAICSALGFPDADPLRNMWKSLGWDKAAHRDGLLPPRPADDELVSRWNELGVVLRKVLGSYEAIFLQALPAIDELAAADPVTDGHVSRLTNYVPNSTPALARFFERATPAWFARLHKKGYFRSPPRLHAHQDGYVTYQSWPPARYLTRMAGEPSLAQAVVDVVLELETDNPEATETVADVALVVPPAMARPLAFKIAQMLESPLQWRLPSKAVKLLPVFVGDGQQEHAAALLATLLPAPTRRGMRSGFLTHDVVLRLFPDMGVAGVAAIAARLAEKPAGRFDDLTHSRLWWPVIDSTQALGGRDQLVTMLRDAAVTVAANIGAVDVVRVLEAYPDGIFHRLALHVLRLSPEPTLVAMRLGDAEAFQDIERFVEYGALLREQFAGLTPADQKLIRGFLDQGPVGIDDAAAVERWRNRQLARFGQALPEQYQPERAALIEKLGEAEIANTGVSATSRRDALALSSVPLAALDPLSDDDLISYLENWVPTGGWDDPDAGDLRQQIADAAGRDPRRFAALAPRFVTLDLEYACGLLGGLRQAIIAAQETGGGTAPLFAWEPVLTLGASAMSEPRLQLGQSGHGDGHQEARWTWARHNLASLLFVGLQRDIPETFLDQALELIVRLFDDPATRDDGSSVDSFATSDVRGEAFRGLLRYAIRRHDPAQPSLPPAVSRLLDKHLDPVCDPSAAVRGLYGEKIHLLAELDPAWTRDRVPRIFTHTTEPGIASAAWNDYLRFSWPSEVTAQLLRPLYEQHLSAITQSPEVNSDPDGPPEDQPKDRLLRHLAILFREGAVTMDSEPFMAFLDHAPLGLRARLIEVVGEQLHGHGQLDNAPADRLKALWTRQLDAARQPGGDLTELAGFGLWFASGALPDDWALGQLNETLAAGATLTPCYDIAARLAKLRPELLPEAVAAMAMLIDAPDEPWFITGATDEIALVLGQGQRSADSQTRLVARRTINKLAARGYASFIELHLG